MNSSWIIACLLGIFWCTFLELFLSVCLDTLIQAGCLCFSILFILTAHSFLLFLPEKTNSLYNAGFIIGLTKKKRYLLAFEYVYEFNLVDKIPPIALVKKHVSHSKQVAKTLCNDGQNTPEAQVRGPYLWTALSNLILTPVLWSGFQTCLQIKALVNEISALKSAIKAIIGRGLEREYSHNQLRQRVIQL